MGLPLGFRPTLRLKLALVALTLLALPWVGYRYVQEMERFLLEAQQQALLATARAVATALHERPQLMRVKPAQADAAQRAAEERLRQAAERAEKSGHPVVVEEIGRESGVSEQQSVAEIGAILRGLERSTSRIWVVNRELKLLALAGSLKPKSKPEDDAGDGAARLWRDILGRIVPRPAEDFDEALDEDVLGTGREIAHALLGAPATRLRASADGRAVIVSAAHPIWSRDDVVGAVVVEETTHSILAVRSQALERLLLATIVVFALAAAVLLGFATRLSNRIRRLRDEAESAVDARGRLKRLTSGSQAGDEIGDLSRSFSAVLEKLAQHHGYLESLAGRLSHELRTPIAVVRSSLENLKLEQDPAQRQVYLERAEEGLSRLSKILTRMSEATRLEQSLRSETRSRFDLAEVVRECVSGYRLAYAQRDFELQAPAQVFAVDGSPDLFAQLLDKLVANAVDFGRPGTPIRIALAQTGHAAQLTVTNSGPPIPDAVRGRLFESMISARGERAGSEPHLGLGLYIARLIAEFHGGSIAAANLPDGSGVSVRLTLPLGAGNIAA
jgi:two-component system sensor histidine kinase ChvG